MYSTSSICIKSTSGTLHLGEKCLVRLKKKKLEKQNIAFDNTPTFLHSVFPGWSWYLPAPQVLLWICPVVSVNIPTAQFVQLVEAVAL
jgi:hypothetical protein